MTAHRPDITAVLLGRDEGPRLAVALHSVLDAAAVARTGGLTVEILVLLADPAPATRQALAAAERHGGRVEETDHTEPGPLRRCAVERANGEYIALLDDGSLWSENWLARAHAVCSSDPGRVIAHPEAYWFFDGARGVYFVPDQMDPEFDSAYLRIANCWEPRCLAPAAAYDAAAEQPSASSDDIDWHWSIRTVADGFCHRVAVETVHFKRARPESLFIDGGVQYRQPLYSRSLGYDQISR